MKKNNYFNFMKYSIVYLIVSMLFIVPSIVSLILWKVVPSIDFTGGALLEIAQEMSTDNQSDASTTTLIDSNKLKDSIQSVSDVQIGVIQPTNNGIHFIVKLNSINESKKVEILDKIRSDNTGLKFTEIRFETVGPSLGQELLFKTGIAILLASLVILMYVAHQFKNKIYGISAIIAMFHDTLILMGSFSLLGHFFGVEVDTLFVTAVLTTLSFSVHDTIVVFDRIRESKRTTSRISFEAIIDRSITETLVRSLNNSMTIIFMLLALVFLGGVTIRWFAVALLIGTIVGTYSSTFVAAPVLLKLYKYKKTDI